MGVAGRNGPNDRIWILLACMCVVGILNILSTADHRERLLVHSIGVFRFADLRFTTFAKAVVQNMVLCHLKPEILEHIEYAHTSAVSLH